MKGLILFHSKYGACEEIAHLLKQELNADCMNVADFDKDLHSYDYIIIGFSVYVGLLSQHCKVFMNNHVDDLICKPLFLFHAGLIKDRKTVEKVYSENIDVNIKEHVVHYDCLGGQLDFPKMNVIEKSLIKMINKKAKFVDKKQMNMRVDLLDYKRIQAFTEKIKALV